MTNIFGYLSVCIGDDPDPECIALPFNLMELLVHVQNQTTCSYAHSRPVVCDIVLC